MSRTTIKMNPARLFLLRSAIKKEELRLQNAANQMARIAAGLEMEVAAKGNIDASLERLRTQLKRDAENMTTMQNLAGQAMSELSQKDEDLANRARNLNGTMQQMGELATVAEAAAAAVGTVSALPGFKNADTLLGLGSQIALDAGSALGSLFGLGGDGIRDILNGVAGLHTHTGDMYNYNPDSGTYREGSFNPVLAGAAGVAGVVGTGFALSQLTDLWDKNGSGKKHAGGRGRHDNKESFWGSLKDSAGKAWNWFGDKASDAAKWVGDKASDAKDWISDTADDVADWVVGATKDVGSWVSDKASDVWNGVKKVASSKPVQYLVDMGGSAVGGVADVFSFMGNVASGNLVDASTDVYSLIDNFFDFAQDTSALAIYGIGKGLESLGVDSEKVQYCYDVADDYAAREGLAGELHGDGAYRLENVVDIMDTGVGIYKFSSGIEKFKKGWSDMSWDSMSDLKDNLFTLSGWKDAGSLNDVIELEDKIDFYKDTSSNYKLGYKYLNSFFSGKKPLDDGGWIYTAAENTGPGKILGGAIDTIDGYIDYLKRNLGSPVGFGN